MYAHMFCYIITSTKYQEDNRRIYSYSVKLPRKSCHCELVVIDSPSCGVLKEFHFIQFMILNLASDTSKIICNVNSVCVSLVFTCYSRKKEIPERHSLLFRTKTFSFTKNDKRLSNGIRLYGSLFIGITREFYTYWGKIVLKLKISVVGRWVGVS